MACVFGTKRDIHNRKVCWKLHEVSYVISKCHELWSTFGLKLDRSFCPPSVNSAFYIARLRRRRSTNGTRPNFGKRWTVNRTTVCRRKVWVLPPKNWDQKTFTSVRFFLYVRLRRPRSFSVRMILVYSRCVVHCCVLNTTLGRYVKNDMSQLTAATVRLLFMTQ